MKKWLLLCLLIAPANVFAQEEPDWSKIETKAEKVSGNIYMLYGVGGFAGGNIGVSYGEDGVVLVDDQFEPLVPKIEAALKTITDKPVRFVLNTHFHGDHSHGNKVFGKKSTIIAHENARKRMAADNEFDHKPGTKAPKHALPLLTFDSRLNLHVNGEDVRAIHLPAAHTDGDVAVFFTKSNVVHMGDTFFNGMYPYIDLESGGTVKGFIAAVEKVLSEAPADAKIIPGHGPLGTRADLANYLAMLKDTSALVDAGIKKGKTLEQLQKEKVLAKYESWAKGFMKADDYIKQLYNSLKGVNKNP